MLPMESREYRRLRALDWSARDALRAAKAKVRFLQLEEDGKVRLRLEPDDLPFEFGDATEEETRAIQAQIDRDGLWGVVVEAACPCCGLFEHVSSVYGFVGDDWKDSGYDTDLRLEAIAVWESRAAKHHAA
jgi:hypothetical protein